MDLKERLMKTLKEKYGIEDGAALMKAVEEQPGIDLGIFVNPQNGEIKSV